MRGGRDTRGFARTPSASLHGETSVAVPPFGIYRPANALWQEDALSTVNEARTSVRAFLLRKHKYPEYADQLRPNNAFGITFVAKWRMQRCASRERIDFNEVLERIGDLAIVEGPLEIPIDHVEMLGSKAVAAVFKEGSAAISTLAAERRKIASILQDAGLPRAPVQVPDHISLMRYDAHRVKRARLDGYLCDQTERIVDAGLRLADIRTVMLDGIIVGNGYTDPFMAESLAVNYQEEDFQLTAEGALA
jgi:hypothetical protein